jgi:hypothetical protein
MRKFPLDTDDDPARTPPQTESSAERGFIDVDTPEDLGKAVESGGDEESDIADETPGHKG